ncbi:hypothetical protein RHSIM_Rhsim02G0186600 [Rhododendron simsii]|uniref:Uncharacterized protein n=1 Tax=Rhododendron simsii TaxID=118357 RepID=A0A834LS39_RHOSS|nr:hypothetical protein RHSIM_Rhsim02G0186600 [Rhododendron simsii]
MLYIYGNKNQGPMIVKIGEQFRKGNECGQKLKVRCIDAFYGTCRRQSETQFVTVKFVGVCTSSECPSPCVISLSEEALYRIVSSWAENYSSRRDPYKCMALAETHLRTVPEEVGGVLRIN